MDEEKTTALERDEVSGEQEQHTDPRQSQEANLKKKVTVLVLFASLLVTALVVMAYFLFFKAKGDGESMEQIRQMQEMTQQVQGMESEVKKKQDEVFDLVDEYKEKTGEDSLGINALELNDDEKAVLRQRIKDEKDVSVKSLLQEILDKNNEIRDLNAKIAEIEKLLPKPHIVTPGENHYMVAMDFLVNEKQVEKKRAMELVERTALLDTLVPGFKVWNFYTGDAYGTSVTQGTAAVSPNTLIRQAKKKLVDARDEAVSQRDKLTGDIEVLEERRKQIVKQVDSLAREKESLIGKVGELNEQVNSLFFLADSQKSLKEKGILKGGFLKSTKLRDISPEYFTMSVDLRARQDIFISSADLGLRKIKGITLYPKFYKRGADYKIAFGPEKLTATVTILDTAKFKNERIVIAVK